MTTNMQIDRLDLRQQIAALDEARKPLAEAVDKIDKGKWAQINAEIERERAIYERERQKADAAFWKRCREIRAAHGEATDDPEKALEAHDAHESYCEAYAFDDGCNALRCCVSGLVLLDDDEIVEDSLGRKALAAAVPGWPLFEAPSDSPSSSRPEGAEVGDGFGLPDGTIDAIADGVAP